MLEDHGKIPVTKFGGLYGRDEYTDSVPADHFIDSLNLATKGEQVGIRDGFVSGMTIANIRKAYLYRRQGEATRIIILNNLGQFFDSGVSLTIPFLTVSAATDFSVLQAYNRLYLSPHNGVSGITAEFTYIYQGSGNARKAAGNKPSSGFNISLSATSGIVEAGTHIFAWCYETDSGFITQPGPTLFQTIDAPGNKALDFSNIPVGPSGTSARRLIASRAIQDYNGNQDGYEMFFVSGGRIANNSSTTLTAVDFYDADLQVTADYTFDQLEEIPSVVFLCSYADRICYGGSNSDKSLVYVSKKNEPESINSQAGFIVCDPSETEGVKSGLEFRDNLYFCKQGKTYVTRENDYEASTWNLVTLDPSIGADTNGMSQYVDKKGASSDFFFVADKGGLFKFNGSYGDPKFHLARKIQNIWNRINKAYINKIQVVFDPTNFLLYIPIPLDSATSPNYIIVGDYQDGLDWENIRWHLWSSSLFNPVSVIVDIDNTTKKNYLRCAGYTGNIYNQEIDRRNDGGNAINHYAQFALLYEEANIIHHFAAIGLRIKGSGSLGINLTGLDGSLSQDLATLTLNSSPGGEVIRQCNLVNEKCSVKLSLNNANSYFTLRSLILYCNQLWRSRPS